MSTAGKVEEGKRATRTRASGPTGRVRVVGSKGFDSYLRSHLRPPASSWMALDSEMVSRIFASWNQLSLCLRHCRPALGRADLMDGMRVALSESARHSPVCVSS
jgi:hypothetical protein